VDAPVNTFGEIKTADGEITLVYEGDEFTVGTAIFVKTEDGEVPAPDGDHKLETGTVITTVNGVITDIKAVDDFAEDVPDEVVEDVVEEVVETIEEKPEIIEDMIEAIAEALVPMMEEMKKEIEEMKGKFASMDKKVETFSNAPAAIKAKEEIYAKRKSAQTQDFRNDEQRKVFERIVNRKLKK
jgi:Mg2+ and Co2+ transporter CorA